jgi:predicted TPR repeat methyltransferase
MNILDAGCGTGMVGVSIADLARCLEGVDLSPATLAIAREKHLYTQLHRGDLVSFIKYCGCRYDAIVSAGTLIHFGDLVPVFEAIAASLVSGGLFIFTLFPSDGDRDYAVETNLNVARGGCYSHRPGYVAELAKTHGFSIETFDTEIHEYELQGQNRTPIFGLAVALRRSSVDQTTARLSDARGSGWYRNQFALDGIPNHAATRAPQLKRPTPSVMAICVPKGTDIADK